jgi:hypothetical protein
MRRSTIVFAAACTAALLIAQGHAQTSSPARLPWGDPDLEGSWTNATLTTLQRAPELGSKAYFTPEEAAAFERQRTQATNADRPLQPGEVGAYNDAFFERGRGVKTRRTSLVVDPPDGRIPAFTPEAQKRFDARQRDEALHPADRPADRWLTERCILFGATVPMLPEPYNNNYRVVQSPGVVTIVVEMNHDARVIPIDGRPQIAPQIDQWTGSSRGHWEGDTLVVETRNFKFNEKSRFGVQYLTGLSDQNLRVVERFTRTDARTLLYQARIEDPTVFTRPWSIEIPMERTNEALFEVACHEGNYGMANILSGHRAEERAVAARGTSK